MARTERTRLRFVSEAQPGSSVQAVLDRDCRDEGCRHYMCHGWKRPETRRERHDARARLRRGDW